MRKIIPVLIVLLGLGIGISVGIFMRPTPSAEPACPADSASPACVAQRSQQETKAATRVANAAVQYVKLDKQFVVPDVRDGRVAALVVMSLSIEITPDAAQSVFEKGPKLRDALLRVMFLHANSGGFEGQFTNREAMNDLRGSLREAARKVLGPEATDVMVTDILRQDI